MSATNTITFTSEPKYAFSWWCFANKGLDDRALLAGAARIGYRGVDLIGEALWKPAQDCGLTIAAIGGHDSIADGLNRPEHAARIEKELQINIEKAAMNKIPVLICFSGNRAGLSDAEGLANCAKTLAKVAPAAEAAGVKLAVELLNSKIDHPDYQCDHSAWGVELCERVGSPAVGLLYDIYHMQIMEGDVIRTVREHHRHFAYYHSAGVPGRGQPDASQELNHAAIFQAISETGYQGFIGQEFLPAGDPLEALAEALLECQAY